MNGRQIGFGAAMAYYRGLIGGEVEPFESNPLAGTASSEIKGADPEMVQLTLINLSANVVRLRPNKSASTTAGIYLAPNGGAVSMDVTRDGTLPAQSWNAIADAANSQLYILGVRRVSVGA